MDAETLLKELHARITQNVEKAPVWYFAEGWYLKIELLNSKQTTENGKD